MVHHILYIDKDFDGIIKDYSHDGNVYPIVKVPFSNIGDTISILDIDLKKIPIVKKFKLLTNKYKIVNPPCDYYSICGGCKGQHFSKEEYIKIKLDNFYRIFQLNSIEINKDVVFIDHLDNPFFQRRRAIFSVDNNKIGFLGYRTNDIVHIDKCLLLKKEINDIIPFLQEIVNFVDISSIQVTEVGNKLDICITSKEKFLARYALYLQSLCLNDTVIHISWRHANKTQTIIEKESLYLKYGTKRIKFLSGGFLQASDFGEDNLQRIVLDNVKANSRNILDLFCGLGGYSLSLIQNNDNIEHICVIDSNTQAIKTIKNLEEDKILPISRDIIKNPLKEDELNKYDAIILNPPRTGAKEQVEEIAKLQIDTIILIYCSLPALARDLKILLSANKGYEIININIIDQFIYSPHMEIVVTLRMYNT